MLALFTTITWTLNSIITEYLINFTIKIKLIKIDTSQNIIAFNKFKGTAYYTIVTVLLSVYVTTEYQ